MRICNSRWWWLLHCKKLENFSFFHRPIAFLQQIGTSLNVAIWTGKVFLPRRVYLRTILPILRILTCATSTTYSLCATCTPNSSYIACKTSTAHFSYATYSSYATYTPYATCTPLFYLYYLGHYVTYTPCDRFTPYLCYIGSK